MVYVVAGPSGAGKGTLIRGALEKLESTGYKKVYYSVSATTRPRGPGEVDGVDYHFLSDEQFDRIVEDGGFLEWEDVYGWRYGTLRSEVERAAASGMDVVLELDVKGALNVRSKLDDAVLIFIMPPSLKDLEKRIRLRKRDAGGGADRRLSSAPEEIKAGKREFDIMIVNDDIEKATEELLRVLRGEKD